MAHKSFVEDLLDESCYEKAVGRGVSEKSVDNDLLSIFMCAEPAKKEELQATYCREIPTAIVGLNK